MALGYNATLRNNQLDEITGLAGASALLRVFSGTRPATGGAETTKLAELVCNATFAAAAAAGVLTLNAIANDTSADATGTATWFRITDSAGTTQIMDGDVATSGSDLNFDSISFVAGGVVAVSSFTVTAGNA
jgi:hypothetical protein